MAASPGMEGGEEGQGRGLSTEMVPAPQGVEPSCLRPLCPSDLLTTAIALPAQGAISQVL